MNLGSLRNFAKREKIGFKRHMLLRMHQREIHAEEVKEALLTCRIVEEYPSDKPLPSALVLGYTSRKRPLHLVVALDEGDEYLWIITGYEPNEVQWERDFLRRRNP